MTTIVSKLRVRCDALLAESVTSVADAILAGEIGGRTKRWHLWLCAVAVLRDEIRRILDPERATATSTATLLVSSVWAHQSSQTNRREFGDLIGRAARPEEHCANLLARARKIVGTIQGLSSPGPERTLVEELYRRGAFRHEFDVAFSVVAIRHHRKTVDEVEAEINAEYARLEHRCVPAYPPS